MKFHYLTIIVFAGIILYACSSSKKATASSAKTEVSLNPGDAEVKALLPRFADVTLQALNDGYAVYTGPCTNCHGQKDIFSRSEEHWQSAIDRMAPKAGISDKQKDVLWKYVLAMKASRGSTK